MNRDIELIFTVLGILLVILGYSFLCYMAGFEVSKTRHKASTIQCPCKAPE